MSNKILISGSCVSRDALSFLKHDDYHLVGYHARSSFAVLSSDILPKNYFNSLSVIPSAFQKRVVEYDFNHNLLKSLENLEFDVFIDGFD